ncbi:MAG: phosphate ABC transporter permease PstA [Blastocatellia bacterium]|jgi:phosphate transport system permease protein|nr:phosphate ABC transporter permease PstA [Blastocatellia bacterium]
MSSIARPVARGVGFRLGLDAVARFVTAGASLLVIAVLVIILGYMLYRGIGAINVSFFTDLPKPVGEPGGGIANAIVGSAIMLVVAILLSLPIGVLAAIYLSEFGHGWFAQTLRFLTDVLAGIPSIVVGIFAYTLIVIPMRSFSGWAGGVALAIIMLPVIIRTTEEMLRLVPQSLRDGGLAVGAPKWRVTVDIVLASSISGIATGTLLAISRALGETAPLLFTALGSSLWTTNLERPMASMPVQIYTYAISPYDEWHQKAWAAAFTLVAIIFVLNVVVRFLTRSKHG